MILRALLSAAAASWTGLARPCTCVLILSVVFTLTSAARDLQFRAETPEAARQWQRDSRATLFKLMMGGARPAKVDLAPQLIKPETTGGYTIEELTLQSLSDRRLHCWITIPTRRSAKSPAMLALHGHGGTGEQVIRGQSLYGYGRALAEAGYVVIAPDIGSHTLQHTNWSLMGERVWDALRCLDYLETRAEVDPQRIGVAGLSLGGETTMYVAALDERVKLVDSSGWFTTVANMKNGHCPCWNFAGLEQHFDFSDIFACVAPRPLVLEIGEKERAPGGFPVSIAQGAFAELQRAYRVFGAESNVHLEIHPGGHVFEGTLFFQELARAFQHPAAVLPANHAR